MSETELKVKLRADDLLSSSMRTNIDLLTLATVQQIRLQGAELRLENARARLAISLLTLEQAQIRYNIAVARFGPESLSAQMAARNLERAHIQQNLAIKQEEISLKRLHVQQFNIGIRGVTILVNAVNLLFRTRLITTLSTMAMAKAEGVDTAAKAVNTIATSANTRTTNLNTIARYASIVPIIGLGIAVAMLAGEMMTTSSLIEDQTKLLEQYKATAGDVTSAMPGMQPRFVNPMMPTGTFQGVTAAPVIGASNTQTINQTVTVHATGMSPTMADSIANAVGAVTHREFAGLHGETNLT